MEGVFLTFVLLCLFPSLKEKKKKTALQRWREEGESNLQLY